MIFNDKRDQGEERQAIGTYAAENPDYMALHQALACSTKLE